jgi:uncharacterized repeat protein (TIGR01451 family)
MASAAHAQDSISPQALDQIRAFLEEKASRTPVQQRIDSQLLAAVRMKRGQAVARGIARLESVWGRVRLAPGDLTEVDIQAEVTPDLVSALGSMGARVESAFPAYRAIRAWVPLARVEDIAALPGVAFVEPAAQAVTNTGSVTSQGDAAHKAPQVRALGLTGAGVKVGVLSDGVNSRANRIASGDLPAGLTVLPSQAGNGDEGTAMLEIVFDLAPSAQLYFATAFNGVASFATNIQALQAAGCNVIVDDVTYFNEGAFQDGPIAQAVNAVTAAGALYFSSAANSGNLTDGTSGTWEGDFVDSGSTISYSKSSAAPVHSFGSGQISDALTAGSSAISLKWSDPLGASANDNDLFVFNSTLTTVLAASTSSQTGAQDPFEIVSSGSPFPAGSRIVVARFSGATRALRIDTNRGRLSIATAGSTFGHNGGEKTITVAATDGRVPGPGNPFVGGATNPIETYSSDGPRRIFYNPNGTAITPGNVLFGTNGGTLLQKPDITAADCVSTTTPGFSPFCGTSAAAPHAGAIAALLLSASPAPTPALVRATMSSSALDIMAVGVDRDSGSGIAMADRSVADVAVTMTGPAAVPAGANAAYTIGVTNNGTGSAPAVQVADPTPAGLTFVSNAGDCTTPFPCALGTLLAGQTRTITATFAVPAAYAGPNPFSNVATVSSGTIDPASANNSASVFTAVAVADLSISKTDGLISAIPGHGVTYTITISNAGPSAASGAQVVDTFPAALTGVTWTCAGSGGGSCAANGIGNISQPVTLPAGASATFTATATINPAATGSLTNTATVTAPGGLTDPNPANNSATDTDTLTAGADLSITKTGPAFGLRGANLAYTITVTNAGPTDATGVQVADPPPPGLSFVSNAGDCTGPFPCSLGTLPAGQSRTITATFAVPSGYGVETAIVNTATVSSTTGDPDTANNASTTTTKFGAFYTVTPCRLVDTRTSAQPLQPGQEKTFVLAGPPCGVPVGAQALSVNLTVTAPTAPGNLRLYPSDVGAPLVSTINFVAGQTRANNAIVAGAADGSVAIKVLNSSAGTVHLILDVNGYFE